MEGPEWLKESSKNWPTAQDSSVNEAEVNSELKKSTQVEGTTLISVKTIEIIEKDSLFYNISTYSKVIRVIGWIKRFIFNCKNSTEARKENFLTAEEYGKVEISLVKIIQSKHCNSSEDECIT